MDLDTLKETLTHKYGPLPGYAWVGIGTGAIVIIAKARGKSSTANGPVTVTPNGDPTGGGSTGGGGGGPLDPGIPPIIVNVPPPPTQRPTPVAVGGGSDGGTRGVSPKGSSGSTSQLTAIARSMPPTTDPAIIAALQAASGGVYIPGSAPTDSTDRAIARHIVQADGGYNHHSNDVSVGGAPVGTAPDITPPTEMQIAPTPSQSFARENSAHAQAVATAGSWTSGF